MTKRDSVFFKVLALVTAVVWLFLYYQNGLNGRYVLLENPDVGVIDTRTGAMYGLSEGEIVVGDVVKMAKEKARKIG